MIKFKFFHNNPITPLEEIIETSNNFTPTQERIIVINQNNQNSLNGRYEQFHNGIEISGSFTDFIDSMSLDELTSFSRGFLSTRQLKEYIDSRIYDLNFPDEELPF